MKTKRQKEAQKIRKANRASAVGRLMLGELKDWQSFLEADVIELENLPRRMLKSGYNDVQINLSLEIKNFCNKNFENMNIEKLDKLYEEIKTHRGLEAPLSEFEVKWSKIKKEVMQGYPPHSTVVLSLWGIQFKFPEHYLSRDILQALKTGEKALLELDEFRSATQLSLEKQREELSRLIQLEEWSNRSCLLSCFNLAEAYFNGLAWQAFHSQAKANLSQNQKKLLSDSSRTSLRDKILKYPKIISGKFLWKESDEPPNSFLKELKIFRDSLVHPSPFTAPESFGGYDKLKKFYSIRQGVAIQAAKQTINIIQTVHHHLHGDDAQEPKWLIELNSLCSQITGHT